VIVHSDLSTEEIREEEAIRTVFPLSAAAHDISQRRTVSVPEQCYKNCFRLLAKLEGLPSSISALGVSCSLLVRFLTSAHFGWPFVLRGEANAGDCKQQPSLRVL